MQAALHSATLRQQWLTRWAAAGVPGRKATFGQVRPKTASVAAAGGERASLREVTPCPSHHTPQVRFLRTRFPDLYIEVRRGPLAQNGKQLPLLKGAEVRTALLCFAVLGSRHVPSGGRPGNEALLAALLLFASCRRMQSLHA